MLKTELHKLLSAGVCQQKSLRMGFEPTLWRL